MLPHERSLVDELKDEPFVLLGVNSDGDAEALKKIMQKESITWPQWVDGSTSGPIASAWNVSGWPTIYVLDAQGVIRDRDVRGDELSDAVHALLDELHGREAASGDG